MRREYTLDRFGGVDGRAGEMGWEDGKLPYAANLRMDAGEAFVPMGTAPVGHTSTTGPTPSSFHLFGISPLGTNPADGQTLYGAVRKTGTGAYRACSLANIESIGAGSPVTINTPPRMQNNYAGTPARGVSDGTSIRFPMGSERPLWLGRAYDLSTELPADLFSDVATLDPAPTGLNVTLTLPNSTPIAGTNQSTGYVQPGMFRLPRYNEDPDEVLFRLNDAYALFGNGRPFKEINQGLLVATSPASPVPLGKGSVFSLRATDGVTPLTGSLGGTFVVLDEQTILEREWVGDTAGNASTGVEYKVLYLDRSIADLPLAFQANATITSANYRTAFVTTATSTDFAEGYKLHFYGYTLVYDGFQHSPMKQFPLRYRGLIDEGERTVTLKIAVGPGAASSEAGSFVPPEGYSQRITHIALWSGESISLNTVTPESTWRMVGQYKMNSFGTNPEGGVMKVIIDRGDSLGEFTSVTGMSPTMAHMDLRYKAGVIYQGKHYVIGSRLETVPDAPSMVFSSLAYRYDTFVWDRDFARLPEPPVAIAGFAGRLFVFSKNGCYVMTPDLALEDSWLGMGVEDPQGVTVTDRGLFWANKSGIYLFTGQTVERLADPLRTTTEPYIPVSGIRTGFDAKRDCLVVRWTGPGATSPDYAACFHVASARWVYRTFPWKPTEFFISPSGIAIAVTHQAGAEASFFHHLLEEEVGGTKVAVLFAPPLGQRTGVISPLRLSVLHEGGGAGVSGAPTGSVFINGDTNQTAMATTTLSVGSGRRNTIYTLKTNPPSFRAFSYRMNFTLTHVVHSITLLFRSLRERTRKI